MDPIYDQDGITLYVGSCLEVLPLLPNQSVDLVLSDPPYGVSQAGLTITRPKGGALNLDFFPEDRDLDVLNRTVKTACALSLKKLKPSGAAYWFCGHSQFGDLEKMLRASGRPTGFLAWRRTNAAPSVRKVSWRSVAELCVWGGRPKNFLGQPEMRNVIDVAALTGGLEKTGHPTQKPIEVISRIILAATDPGDMVLDCFAGSGTTLRAAANLGRRAIGIELRPEYAQMAVGRMRQMVLPLELG